MTDRFRDRLSEFLDGELTEEERLLVERHLGDCAECARTLVELDRVREHARDLPARQPDEAVWAGISARIREIERTGRDPGDVEASPRGRRRFGRIAFTVPQLAAAAVTLAAVSASGAWWASSRAGAPEITDSRAAPGALAIPAADGGTGSAAARGAATIEALERALFERDLPPRSRARIERALTTIDRAIEDAREALRLAPGDRYLEEHVAGTLDRKTEFLTRTLRLTSQS